MREGKAPKMDKKSLVFMNTPIRTPEEDVIGFDTYVEKLATAIDNDGQMIALTSPFGAGKTSIIELLQAKYTGNPKTRIIKISMWSHLCDQRDEQNKCEGDTTALHSGFVYQLISQINPRKGLYISKRMNPSYGLLKLHAEKLSSWLYFIFSIALFFIFYVLPNKFSVSLPLGEYTDAIVSTALLVAAIFFLIAVTRGEIVFSSNKSEGGRRIDTNEVMQLYRSVVLFPWYGKVKNWLSTSKLVGAFFTPTHYIVVIEDLDRTDDEAAVINFLKELRKYYIPESSTDSRKHYANRVTFLINVKPETQLCKKEREKEEFGRLYAKLFDYVLNLQTINIDDYQTILRGLLEKNKENIFALGLTRTNEMLDIPGMRWIIHGKNLGIREIKDRLNIAFSLYESLKAKFPETPEGISFEKCAVAAYVTTEFEADFYATEDNTFQKLVEVYLKSKNDDKTHNELLANASDGYKTAIQELIHANLIDSNYRMYFYNYPKGSRIYTTDELCVQSAILYEKYTESLEHSVRNVVQAGSDVVADSFKIRTQLGLMLPNVVFKSEKLYIEALKLTFSEVMELLGSLDGSISATTKTIEQIKTILRYDNARQVFSSTHAKAYCEVFEELFGENQILQLRKMLCQEFSGEIVWYKPLFFGLHEMITQDEIDIISLCDALVLINKNSDSFDEDVVSYVTQKFTAEENFESVKPIMLSFLKESIEPFAEGEVLADYLAYMSKTGEIIPEFEAEIMKVLEDGVTEENEPLFRQYQDVINLVAESGLTQQTLENICSCDEYNGYAPAVTAQLDKEEFLLDYILQLLCQGRRIPFERQDVADRLERNVDWLLQKDNFFTDLRILVAKHDVNVLSSYRFMFTASCPIMTSAELKTLSIRGTTVEEIISLIPPELVTLEHTAMLQQYFCSSRHRSPQTYAILLFISKMADDVAKELFCSLDFDAVKYRDMSGRKKSDIKAAFKAILDLDTVEGKIEFMRMTKYLDTTWEISLLKQIKADENLRDAYVDAVNNSTNVSQITIRNLSSISISPMNNEVIEKFFYFKYYTQYVVCKTITHKNFEIEAEHKDLLWSTYISIFKQAGYHRTRKYMANNHDFLEEIMEQKEYLDITNDNLLPLARLLQTKECIEYVFTLDSELCLEYMKQVHGFKDRDAAVAFVTAIEKSPEILHSDEVYNNVHSKLIDGHLKAKYTRMRNKYLDERS